MSTSNSFDIPFGSQYSGMLSGGMAVSDTMSFRVARTNGFEAHHDVPMDSWCVTRLDLIELRALVKEAVQKGHVLPTELDKFDPMENSYGPCIHTVVSQLIKPITYMAGSQSWALMKHPQGLKCDLFVTHGWAEGIYEFIDKVLYSWPRGARHAYCCMLSNPQNLDISVMIASPVKSPFALALGSASRMLVIPNRKGSIYSRIWCVYEAYLAYKWNKTILVASSAPTGFWAQLVLAALIAITSSLLPVPATIAYAWKDSKGGWFYMVVFSLTMMVPLLPPSLLLRVLNYAGIVTSCVGFQCMVVAPSSSWEKKDPGNFLLHFNFILFFIASEVDRMNLAQATLESNLLEQGFTGRVQNASSSVQEDKVKILGEIRSRTQEAAVDHTIDVLLRAGMSTVNLRKVANHGISVVSAGTFRSSFLVLWLGFSVSYALAAIMGTSLAARWYGRKTSAYIGVAICTQLAIWICFFAGMPKDSRAFSADVVFKMMLALFLPTSLAGSAAGILSCHDFAARLWFMTDLEAVGFGSFALLISAIGLGRLVSIPWVGPCLTRFILARSVKDATASCCVRRLKATSLARDGPLMGGVVELAAMPNVSKTAVNCGCGPIITL